VEPEGHEDYVGEFATELLRSGIMLSELLAGPRDRTLMDLQLSLELARFRDSGGAGTRRAGSN
jgi:hypothetical protein